MSCVEAESAASPPEESRSQTAESVTNAAILLADKDFPVLFLRHYSDQDGGFVRASCHTVDKKKKKEILERVATRQI